MSRDYTESLYGAGIDTFFKGAPKVPAPWPSAGRQKSGSPHNQDLIQETLRRPPELEDVDPRNLHATQSSVLLEHVQYYATESEYHRTGRPVRDAHINSNQFPMVYERADQRRDILAGHHRFAAALLEGRSEKARVVREVRQ